MCVIFIVDTESNRPSPEMVEAGWDENPNGGGVAWQDQDEGVKRVQWRKGLSLQEMQDYALTLPKPFVMHFRIPSVGGPLKALTHPFTVDENASLELEGETDGSVLFHNGTWSRWKESLLDLCIGNGIPVPEGKWSDTRAMAFIASHCGTGFLDLIDEKVVVVYPDDIVTFGFWSKEEGIYCSNTHWKRKLKTSGRSLPAVQSWNHRNHDFRGTTPSTAGSPGTATNGASTVPSSTSGTLGVGQLGPSHHTGLNDCSCNDCVAERISVRIAENEAREHLEGSTIDPLAGGSDSEASNPSLTPTEIQARTTALQESGARIAAAKKILDVMSKNSLKKLRKRMSKKPEGLSELERRILALDAYRQRKAAEAKYGKSVH